MGLVHLGGALTHHAGYQTPMEAHLLTDVPKSPFVITIIMRLSRQSLRIGRREKKALGGASFIGKGAMLLLVLDFVERK